MHSEDGRGKYLCGAVQRIVERSQGKKIHTKIKKKHRNYLATIHGIEH